MNIRTRSPSLYGVFPAPRDGGTVVHILRSTCALTASAPMNPTRCSTIHSLILPLEQKRRNLRPLQPRRPTTGGVYFYDRKSDLPKLFLTLIATRRQKHLLRQRTSRPRVRTALLKITCNRNLSITKLLHEKRMSVKTKEMYGYQLCRRRRNVRFRKSGFQVLRMAVQRFLRAHIRRLHRWKRKRQKEE